MKLFLLLIPILLTAACGTRGPSCAFPLTETAAFTWLEGAWTVRDHEDETEGGVTFDGNRVKAEWDEVTLLGEWEQIASAPNALTIRLVIDEAMEGDVRIRYGVFDEVDLTLVFATPGRLYALQGEGVWTVWERVAVVQP